MTKQQTFRQVNAFAMLYGLWLGLYCSFGFLCVVRGIMNSSLGMMGLLVTVTAPVFGAFLARKFEKQVRSDAPVSYGKGYLFSALMYLYSAAILAIVAFAYFSWFDDGMFASAYISALNSPEMQQVLKSSQLNQTLSETAKQAGFSDIEEMIRGIRPVDIAASMFNTNILLGLILSIFTGLFAKTPQYAINK